VGPNYEGQFAEVDKVPLVNPIKISKYVKIKSKIPKYGISFLKLPPPPPHPPETTTKP
jgi:hypothetical protein